MTLVERDKERATLDGAHTDCLTGNGQVVSASGAVATGKTALLHSFAKRAAERGALLLTAVASRAERTLPLGVMYQLFRGADLPAASRERVGRLLDAGSLGALPADEGAEEETDRLPPALQALCDESLNLAARHPTVIVIDDLQYADASSLRWVQYLARRLAFVGLMLVVADGRRSLHANARLPAELFRQPYCRRLSLRLLSEDGVRAVLEDDVREPLPADAAPAYHQASGGNPLLVRALIDDRAGALAAPRAEPVIGDAYHRAVSNCLIRGEPAALQAAKALAILDSPCSTALIGRLAGLNAHTAAPALKSLAATGLVAAGRFRHGDMRRAVLDGAPPEERSTLHLTAAGLLYEAGAAPRTVARHLIATDVAELRRGTMPWCLPVLREAGEQALLSGEVTLAIACFRQAYQACKSDDDRVAIASELSRAERRVDPSAVARHLPQ